MEKVTHVVPVKQLHLLMPTYNRAHMLERTLSGVFSQDAALTSWHLTVVDNASTDGTRQILERYSKEQPNFDFVVNEQNLGLFGNLNRCMSLAQTEKYMIVHSDDDIDPTLVSKVLSFLKRHPDANMCFGTCRARLAETDEVIPNWYRSSIIGSKEKIMRYDDFLSALIRSGSPFIFAPTVVYDRQFFDSSLRYSTEYEFASDLDLWFKVAMRRPTVGFLPDPLITCGIHAGRLSSKHADPMRLEAVHIVRKYIRAILDRPDIKVLNAKLAFFLKIKLHVFELAIRHHLVPGFKMRRRIAGLLDLITPGPRDPKSLNEMR